MKRIKHIEKAKIAEVARSYLNRNDLNYSEICRETGISREWILKVKKGQISNPGVLNCEKLLAYAGYKIDIRKSSKPSQLSPKKEV